MSRTNPTVASPPTLLRIQQTQIERSLLAHLGSQDWTFPPLKNDEGLSDSIVNSLRHWAYTGRHLYEG